ncbi:hypothetical protein CRG98_012512 [Punica granatum]|uniref:PPIase cyclophilin-type domain-containing protein n=1 Tax=Punica granatum TaxID=22663 RepID=A0A2I0KEZ8_PUNGR|nr:hypothetical protein CRG98_012512 [Punica granatum]
MSSPSCFPGESQLSFSFSRLQLGLSISLSVQPITGPMDMASVSCSKRSFSPPASLYLSLFFLHFWFPQVVTLHTNLGDIEREMAVARSPRPPRQNFLLLCASVYYNRTIIHRDVKGFTIQGGGPTGTGEGGTRLWGKKFDAEITESLKLHLDRLHTVFGRVIRGFEVLDLMERERTMIKDSRTRVEDPRHYPIWTVAGGKGFLSPPYKTERCHSM